MNMVDKFEDYISLEKLEGNSVTVKFNEEKLKHDLRELCISLKNVSQMLEKSFVLVVDKNNVEIMIEPD